jgi:anti-sigma B factor antagonist
VGVVQSVFGSRRPFEFRLTSAEFATGSYVVTISGELDVDNSGRIHDELERLSSADTRTLVVDLLEVPFLESSTLGVLLAHARRLRSNGGELTVVTDDPRILRVFEITGLQSHFRFERSLGAAIESVLEQAYR